MSEQKMRAPDSKHRVAYEMAYDMWTNTKSPRGPSLEDVDEFLDLVTKCIMALNVGIARDIEH